MSGALLSKLAKDILDLAAELPTFAPSQVQSWETSDTVLDACHRLVNAGYLKQVRKGTQGNFSKLIPYHEALFALNNENSRTIP
jgi:hypothetical protein